MKRIALATTFIAFGAAAWAGADIRAFDLNGDRFVSFAEMSETIPTLKRSEFRAIDLNGDRRLSANEMSGAGVLTPVARLKDDPQPSHSGPFTLSSAGFNEIDADHNGRISFDELLRADGASLTSLRGN